MPSRFPPSLAPKYSSGQLREPSVLVWISMPTTRRLPGLRFTVLEQLPTRTAAPTSRLKVASPGRRLRRTFWAQLLLVLLILAAVRDRLVTTYVRTVAETARFKTT